MPHQRVSIQKLAKEKRSKHRVVMVSLRNKLLLALLLSIHVFIFFVSSKYFTSSSTHGNNSKALLYNNSKALLYNNSVSNTTITPSNFTNDTVITPSSRRNTSFPFGVNLWADIDKTYGVSESARGVALQLLEANIPFVINALDLKNVNFPFSDKLGRFISAPHKAPYFFNLVVALSGHAEEFRKADLNLWPEHYNIALFWWELEELNSGWDAKVNLFDEILCVTDFVANAFRKHPSKKPVHTLGCIGLPELAYDIHTKDYPLTHFGLSEDSFIFMYSWDYLSDAQRKNPDAAVHAYAKAFYNCDKVVLVLKCKNGSPQHLVDTYKPKCPVKIIDQDITEDEMYAIFKRISCYVSLHRSEGFGNTIAHAMKYGKPVIFTNYSAPVEFANDSNSYPVKWSYVPVPTSWHPSAKWAEADVDHAAEQMQRVFVNQEEAKIKGENAANHIRKVFSPKSCGEKTKEYLVGLY